ncbi:MAG: alpha/beta hydrolase [Chloroflexi bacterium]|nr:alpha/beta hydrolase [Chloroflexota bacterium]
MFINHNDAQLFTVAFGNQPHTLLALGGWAGSWELWTQPFTYLSQSWRTIAYDHRGTGATVAPVESITVENMVEDVFAVLDYLEVQDCVLAAESAGCLIALLAALRQPQRFTGLVLVGSLTHRPLPTNEDPFLEGLQHNFEATIDWFVDACVPEPNSDMIKRWGRQILARSESAAAIRLYECVLGLDLRSQLDQIRQPTLLLHGELDALASVDDVRQAVALLPQAELCVFKDTGHVPTVTRPQEVAEAINRFFK